ncbi:MAG TPA: MBOAT family O-acyltransferase [Bacteroidales bacterium]|nr:MBOAT family protein [Bacteroidales bacterium]HQN14955.1 MBOAT family O-acyltransferase [Bacteroidales bacterium]HQP14492.1 MBOAT family O-acyltransferase [Bacteroidales bacterium]
MVFSSVLFLFFFLPITLLLYYITRKRYKNLVALLASVVFYAWGAPLFVFVIFGSIICDFLFAKYIHKSEGLKKKLLLTAAISLNVGILIYFKYANFFVENLNTLLYSFGFTEIQWVKIALPIGISFFTFHEMSYVIDVYRGVKPPMKNILNYALYILFFPQLIAGPIIRFNEISDQIEDRRYQFTVDNNLLGFFRFVIGLAKKVLIANVLGEEADKIFALGFDDLTTPLAWLGILAYAFQIYFDFSGYSDMAIGLARMMGFIFPENFNNPYISQSITEFWRRWHMSLSRWMRDYLYISLGGNRVSVPRMYFNLAFVFLISGFWHGAEWNFIFWGAFHGLFLILDRLFLLKLLKRIGKIPSILFAFFVTLMGWVLFRCESPEQIKHYFTRLFDFTLRPTDLYFDSRFVVMLFVGVFFSFFGAFGGVEKWQEHVYASGQKNHNVIFLSLFSIFLFVICSSAVVSSGFNPFIYFRF